MFHRVPPSLLWKSSSADCWVTWPPYPMMRMMMSWPAVWVGFAAVSKRSDSQSQHLYNTAMENWKCSFLVIILVKSPWIDWDKNQTIVYIYTFETEKRGLGRTGVRRKEGCCDIIGNDFYFYHLHLIDINMAMKEMFKHLESHIWSEAQT